MASTAMARGVRRELREYSVSPTPTMQYRSLSDFIGPPVGADRHALVLGVASR
jgi:hypothetical protein